MKVNYIEAHRALIELMRWDVKLRPIHVTFMHGLFYFWNKSQWKDEFQIARQDLMEVCKTTNRKTYYKVLNELQAMKYLIYKPSKNPEIASSFSMGKKCTSVYTCGYPSNGSCDGSSGTTILKHVNKETYKQLGQNELILWNEALNNDGWTKQLKETFNLSDEKFKELFNEHGLTYPDLMDQDRFDEARKHFLNSLKSKKKKGQLGGEYQPEGRGRWEDRPDGSGRAWISYE